MLDAETNVGRLPIRETEPNARSVASDSAEVCFRPAEEVHSKKHFGTEHLLVNLRARTISSGFITTLAQAVQFGVTLGSTMVLARLLMPQDFGVVAMATAVTGFLRIFKDFGLSTATVQREHITHAQVSNLFWINMGVSGLIGLVVAGCAPLISWFYRDPRLISITLLLATTFFLDGSTIQHLALLNRQMRFKKIAVIQVGATVSAVALAVTMAALKCGYWSLVGMQLGVAVVTCLLTWALSDWRPQMPVRGAGTRSLLGFGASWAMGSFIWSLACNADGMLIGRFYGAEAVGLYSRAAALLNRPLDQLLSPLSSVFIPALSRLQGQPERYRRTFLQIYDSLGIVSCFLAALFLALARPITLIVLGHKWEAAIPIFAGLSLVFVSLPLNSAATWLFASQGRGAESLLAKSAIAVVALCSILAGLPFGPKGVAISYSSSGLLVLLPVMCYFAGKSGPVTRRDLRSSCLRCVPVFGFVYAMTYLAGLPLSGYSPIIHLLLAGSAGGLLGGCFVWLFPGTRGVVRESVNVMRALRRPA